MRSAALALLVVLACSARCARAGSYEEVAVWPGGALRSCTVDLDTCEADRKAVANGLIQGIPRDAETRCAPADCFAAREMCIPGYRGPRPEGYCR